MNAYCSMMIIACVSASCTQPRAVHAPPLAEPTLPTTTPVAVAPDPRALEVVSFWRAAGPSMWFAKDPAFDQRFRERFLALHEDAVAGALTAWLGTPEESLALLILLDQFPRNAFRGTPRMYATDALARTIADRALEAGHDGKIEPALRVFMYLPFGHSERLADQERSVALNRALGPTNLAHAEHHRDIVRRFGRFPHRNAILGRKTTPEEQTYLDEGGFQG